MSVNDIVLNMTGNENESYDLFTPKLEKTKIYIPEFGIEHNNGVLHLNETIQLRNAIRETANSLLFHWKSCSIAFPPSLTGLCDGLDENSDYRPQNFKINLQDLFKIPSVDELDEVSVDSQGNRKRLNKEQLQSIKRAGEFEVDSVNFPGQKHKWRLHKMLQLGYERSNEGYYKDLSKALYLLIVTAKRRFYADRFSLLQSLKAWKIGITRLIDILIGLPALCVVPYHNQLIFEEESFLIQELVVDPSEQEIYEDFCKKFNEINNAKDKYEKIRLSNFNFPHLFRNENNELIDMRLFNQSLMKDIYPILEEVLRNDSDEDKKWFTELRRESLQRLKDENISNDEKFNRLSKILVEQYMNRVFEKILKSEAISKISPTLGQLLVNQARSQLIMCSAVKNVNALVQKHMDDFEQNLKKQYRVKAKIYDWLKEQLDTEKARFIKLNQFQLHEIAIQQCEEANLEQAVYFLKRELQFRKEHEEKLVKKFEKVKEPKRRYTFNRNIWFPKNWIINKHENDQVSVVKTVIKKTPITKKYSQNRDEPYYTVKKYTTYNSDTRYPFWRWRNFFLRTWTYLCNTIFYLGIVIPICSPISYTALFKCSPFYPNKDVDQSDGCLHPKQYPKILTFASRIRAIWRNIRESRAKFESIPDKGIIGKTVQRFFNRIWNYVFKGLIGTLGVVTIFPALSLCVSTASLIAAITCPIWFPFLGILIHISNMFIFDFDYPDKSSFWQRLMVLINIILYRFVICGTLQPIAALVTSFIICPTLSLLVTLYATICCVSRFFWDNFMFFCILKRQGKLPSHDTFFAIRTSGPGLASNFFYQITVEQALFALEAHLECQILDAYNDYVSNILEKPLVDYKNFFDNIFKHFAYGFSDGKATIYNKIYDESHKYMNKYSTITNKRKELLRAANSSSEKTKIRLNEDNLKIVLLKATEIVKRNYLKYILPYRKQTTEKFFENLGIENDDWSSFTGTVLEQVFSPGFLIPLEHSDNYFKLDVDHLDLSKYTKMIANSTLRDDLDMVLMKYNNPKSNSLYLKMPHEDKTIFNPTIELQTASLGNLRNTMHIPTKLPLTGMISLMIDQRNNQNQKPAFNTYSSWENLLKHHFEKTVGDYES